MGAVLVVDDDAVSRHVLTQTLVQAGFEQVVPLSGGAEALAWLASDLPALILLDLIMPAPDGYEVLRTIRDEARLRHVPVVVLTGLDSDKDIRKIFAHGADDYIRKPFSKAELIARIRGQLRIRDYVEQLSHRERSAQTLLELTQTLASSLDIRDILFTVADRLAKIAQVDRCSIVLASDDRVGYVVASSDDQLLKDLPLDLEKYPEIRQVLNSGHSLVIRDATQHPLLSIMKREEPAVQFYSLALVPILHENKALGVLFLRSRQLGGGLERALEVVTTVANATAIALRNARILKSLRDQSEQSSVARAEAEQKVQLFQRYADFFENAAEGMMVMDQRGGVLFSNTRARELTGYSAEELKQGGFGQLLVEPRRAQTEGLMQRLMQGFEQAAYPLGMDLEIRTKKNQLRTLSVNFSSVLNEGNVVLFTFRDVTRERQTALELKRTKEFLELVIDSSLDAVVSADLSGKVVLFNRAASRIFGYAPEDVVGRASVEAFYPPGVAREIMRKLRSEEGGGAGRLDDYRVDMIGSQGETIQTRLSAALILEGGKPIASVGIFTDIRDQLRIQSSLEKAEEELRARERQAIVAELAGTAAHELNQPLTSVIGYAEFLRRHLTKGSQAYHAAEVITTEAERMAEIVRKIGKITHYETKSYVGEARILDLDKASEADK